MPRHLAQSQKRTRSSKDLSPARTQQLDKRLLTYALAGAGVVALTPAANAEIVYTPAEVTLTHGTFQLDLNQDGINDFHLTNHETRGSFGAYPAGTLQIDGHGNTGAAVIGPKNTALALALHAGFPIGKDSPKPFVDAEGQHVLMANAFCYPLAGQTQIHPLDCQSGGLWKHIVRGYLGLRFQVNGETHYGWARLSVTSRWNILPLVKAHLTGYAYETEPDKTIAAGDMGSSSAAITGSDDAQDASMKSSPNPTPASLGMLSLGAPALDAWRPKRAAHTER